MKRWRRRRLPANGDVPLPIGGHSGSWPIEEMAPPEDVHRGGPAREAAPGHQASIATGLAAPAIKYLAVIQDSSEVRRAAGLAFRRLGYLHRTARRIPGRRARPVRQR